MKKIKSILKKISATIIVSFFAMPTAIGSTEFQLMYGIPPAKPIKKEPQPKVNFPMIIIIPIIFVYGITLYLLKSKSSKERKIRIAIFATLVTAVFCIGIYRFYMDPDFKDVVSTIIKNKF